MSKNPKEAYAVGVDVTVNDMQAVRKKLDQLIQDYDGRKIKVTAELDASGITNTKKMQKSTKTMGEQFARAFQTKVVSQTISSMITELQNGIDTIAELDTALVAMRRTMNGTDAQFFELARKMQSDGVGTGVSKLSTDWMAGIDENGLKKALDSIGQAAEMLSATSTVVGKMLPLLGSPGVDATVLKNLSMFNTKILSEITATFNGAANAESTGDATAGNLQLTGMKSAVGDSKNKTKKQALDKLKKFGNSKVGQYLASEKGSALAHDVGTSLSTMVDDEIGGTVTAITTGLGAVIGSVIPGVGTALGAAVGSLVSPLVTMAVDALYVTDKELAEMRQKSQEITSTWKENRSALESNKAVLQSLRKEYEILSKGVGSDGENLSLNTSDYERYKEICNEIAKISPELVKGYDAQNNAILRKNSSLVNAMGLLEKQQGLEDANLLKSKDDVFNAAKESAKKLKKEKRQADIGLSNTRADIYYDDKILKMLSPKDNTGMYGDKTNQKVIDDVSMHKNQLQLDRVQYLSDVANAEKQINAEAANVFDTIGAATLRQSSAFQEMNAQAQNYMMVIGRTLDPAQFKNADDYQKGLIEILKAFNGLGQPGNEEKQQKVMDFLELKEQAEAGKISIKELNDSYNTLDKDLVKDLHLDDSLDKLNAIKDTFKETTGMIPYILIKLGKLENLSLDGLGNLNLDKLENLNLTALEKIANYLNSFGEGQGEAAKKAFDDLQVMIGQLNEGDFKTLNGILGDVDPTSAASVQDANEKLTQFFNTAKQVYGLDDGKLETFFNVFKIGADKIQTVTDQFSGAIAAAKSYANQIANISDAYATLANGGTLGFETILELLEDSPELGNSLTVGENGVPSLGKDGLYAMLVKEETDFRNEMGLKKKDLEATQRFLKEQLEEAKESNKPEEDIKKLELEIEKNDAMIAGINKLLSINLINSLNGGDAAQKALDEYNKKVSEINRDLAKTIDDINKSLAKLDEEERLNALTDSIRDAKTEIDALSSSASLIDTELDIAWENDFVTKSDLLSEKLVTMQEKARLMKEEFERLAATTPKNAKEAQTLADRLQSLGEEIRSNMHDLVDLNNQISTLRIEAISSNTEGVAEQLEREMSLLDRNLAAMEEGFILGDDAIFSDMFILPVISKDLLEQKREENDQLIEEERQYQETVLEVIKAYHRLQSKENQRAINEQREQLKQRRTEAENTAAERKAAAHEGVGGRGGGSGDAGNPSQGYAVTAYYGQKGGMWSSGYHTGVDYAFPEGTPVISNVSGIAYVNTKGTAYGTHVTVVDENGYSSLFAHLSRADVASGQTVHKGVQLGLSGSTGNVSGPHLHYEVRDPDNRTINPGSYVGRAAGGVVGQGEFTLVGEGNGQELVVLPDGQAVMLGQDGAELVSLPAGTTVFSAEDTAQIVAHTGDMDGVRVLKLEDLTQMPNLYSAAFAEEYRRISTDRMQRYDKISELNASGDSAAAKTLKKQLQDDNFMDTYTLAFHQYANAVEGYTANLEDAKRILDAAIAAGDMETVQAAMEAIEIIQNAIFDTNEKWVENRRKKLEYLQKQALDTLKSLQELQQALEFDDSMRFEHQLGIAYFSAIDQYRVKTQQVIDYERVAYENLSRLYQDQNMTEQDRLVMEEKILEDSRRLQQEKNTLFKQMLAAQKSYNKQRVAALNDVQGEIVEMLQWSVDEEKKRLDENLENYRNAVQEKISLIDEEAAAADYEKRLKKEQEKLLELQQQAAKLSASTRYEDKSRLRELNKQIAEQQEALDEMQDDHQREIRKKSLQDQLDAEEEAIDQRKEWIDDEFSNEKSIQKAREGMLTGYVTLANGEYVKLTEAMRDYYDATCVSTLEASSNLQLFNSDLEQSVALYRQLKEIGLAGGNVGDIGWTADNGTDFLGLTDAELKQYIANKAEWTYLNSRGSNKTAADVARMNQLAAANAQLRKGQSDSTNFSETYQLTGDLLSQQERDFAQYLANKDEYQRLYRKNPAENRKRLDDLQAANDAIREQYSGFAGRGGDIYIPYEELLRIFGVTERYRAYAMGGIDTRGGLALLHGTAQNPEYIFNTPQMKEIEAIVRSATFGAIRLSQDIAFPAAVPPDRSTTLQIENLIRVDGDVTDKSALPDIKTVAMKVAKTILDAAPRQ